MTYGEKKDLLSSLSDYYFLWLICSRFELLQVFSDYHFSPILFFSFSFSFLFINCRSLILLYNYIFYKKYMNKLSYNDNNKNKKVQYTNKLSYEWQKKVFILSQWTWCVFRIYVMYEIIKQFKFDLRTNASCMVPQIEWCTRSLPTNWCWNNMSLCKWDKRGIGKIKKKKQKKRMQFEMEIAWEASRNNVLNK